MWIDGDDGLESVNALLDLADEIEKNSMPDILLKKTWNDDKKYEMNGEDFLSFLIKLELSGGVFWSSCVGQSIQSRIYKRK